MPKYLALYLDAPLMSWGDSSPTHKIRGTASSPTLSALQGMVACCMGLSSLREPNKFLQLCQSISFAKDPIVLSGKAGLLVDDQVSRGTGRLPDSRKRFSVVTTSGKPPDKGAGMIYQKHYLTDVVFGVVLEVSDQMLISVDRALSDPVWPPFFGRKCCIPASPIFHGAYDTPEGAEEVLRKIER